MSWDSLVYLSEVYWPFLLAATFAGLLVGWFSYRPRAQR
jgi:hypothetical protein